jgi:hypothetical protein
MRAIDSVRELVRGLRFQALCELSLLLTGNVELTSNPTAFAVKASGCVHADS